MSFIVRNVYEYLDSGVKRYFVYIGDSDIANNVYGGEINLPDPGRESMLTTVFSSMVLFTDVLLNVKDAYSCSQMYLKGKPVSIPANEFTLLVDKISSNLIDNYSGKISNTISSNYDSSSNELFKNSLNERIIRLLKWNERKKWLCFDKTSLVPTIKRFNCYFAYMGTNVGSEIEKMRPVIIWKEHKNSTNPYDNSYFVFPISSRKHKKTIHTVKISVNGADNYIRISDGRRISIRRFEKPLKDMTTGKTYILSEDDIQKVKDAIKKYFSL